MSVDFPEPLLPKIKSEVSLLLEDEDDDLEGVERFWRERAMAASQMLSTDGIFNVLE